MQPQIIQVRPYRRFGYRDQTWPIRLRHALLLPINCKWNAWVRDFTAWLERR